GVEPICLGPPMLARYRDARCVNDMGLDVTCPEPSRQPEAVAAGLEGHRDARDLVSRPHRFIAPAIEQRKQGILICLQLLECLALDAGYDTGNQPARQAQLDYGNQRRIHVEGDQGSAKVIRLALLWHRGLRRSGYIRADGCNLLAARPIESAQPQQAMTRFGKPRGPVAMLLRQREVPYTASSVPRRGEQIGGTRSYAR